MRSKKRRVRKYEKMEKRGEEKKLAEKITNQKECADVVEL